MGKLRCVQPEVQAWQRRLDAICRMWIKASFAVSTPVMAVQALSSANQASRLVVPGESSASCSKAHTGR